MWTGVCLTFVFAALLEFALVNYASRSDAHREKMKKQRKQWELEHQAALEAMAADGLLDDRNSFAMVSHSYSCEIVGKEKMRVVSIFICRRKYNAGELYDNRFVLTNVKENYIFHHINLYYSRFIHVSNLENKARMKMVISFYNF